MKYIINNLFRENFYKKIHKTFILLCFYFIFICKSLIANPIEQPEDYVFVNKNCKVCINGLKSNSGCIISKDGKILLVRYKNTGKLSLPGGLRDGNESSVITASREVMQDTGYVVAIEDFVTEFTRNKFRLYKCKIIKETGKTNNKISEFKWVDKEGLKNLIQKEHKNEVSYPYELQLVYGKFEWMIK